MKIKEPIASSGIFDEVNRILGVSDAVYPNKDKIARLNNALDMYWFLAIKSASTASFDDINYSSTPIETQNIVSGTNAYKVSDFTNKVLQILRVSVLDSAGDETDLIREDFDNIQEFNELYSTDSSDQGDSFFWTKMGDYIYLRNTPNYNSTSGLRAYVNRELSKASWVTFTTTNATDKIDKTAHGLSNGDSIILTTSGGDLPSGLTADTVIYYVVNKTADDFEVSTSIGGTKVSLADDGTGTHQYVKVSTEPGIPGIHHPYLARKIALDFMKPNHPQFAKILKQIGSSNSRDPQFGGDELDISEYWRIMEQEDITTIKTAQRSFR